METECFISFKYVIISYFNIKFGKDCSRKKCDITFLRFIVQFSCKAMSYINIILCMYRQHTVHTLMQFV